MYSSCYLHKKQVVKCAKCELNLELLQCEARLQELEAQPSGGADPGGQGASGLKPGTHLLRSSSRQYSPVSKHHIMKTW
jgi:hypothetical protein